MDQVRDFAERGITSVEMDVTEAGDNERVVREIIDGEGRIDVLVNNAGFGFYGPVALISLDEARYQFEVHLFGLAHLTQLVLPHMRARGSGRIINTSSVVGRTFSPFGAWYQASKHALEGWSDCLRLETAPFNIQVVLVEPGAIRTEFGDVMGERLGKHRDDAAYGPGLAGFFRMLDDSRIFERGTDPKDLAGVFLKAATTARPRRRYVSGAMARPALFIRKWLGDGVYEALLRRAFR